MIRIKAFEIKDLDGFESKFEFEDLSRDMKMNLLDINKMMFSIVKENELVAVAGLTQFRKGAGELWLIPGTLVDKNKWGFFKVIKSLIYDFVFNELRFHRLEIAIEHGWEKGMKWARTLGFDFSHFCDGYDTSYADHIIYKKVIKWQPEQQ